MDPLAFIISLARDAGTLLHERFDGPRTIEHKSPKDLVTDADRASEALIVAAVREHFPGAAILGEEGGVYAGTSGERFIVDPLDGTSNYAHHYPMYCVSIGYERNGELLAGAIYAPALGELFAARLGGGATRNGAPIGVSRAELVFDAMLCTGFVPGPLEQRNIREWTAASRAAQAVRRDGSAALDLAGVAMGRFDAFWEWRLKPWDVAAGTLIVREAGGTVSSIDGTPFDIAEGSILATNGKIHAELAAVIAGA